MSLERSAGGVDRSAERVTVFYNRCGEAEQWIKEGKHAINWTRLFCQKFRANEVRLQLHALANNLANFLRTLALPPGDGALVAEHAPGGALPTGLGSNTAVMAPDGLP